MSDSSTENLNTGTETGASEATGSPAASPPVIEGEKAVSPPAEGVKELLVDRIKQATDKLVDGKSPIPTEPDKQGDELPPNPTETEVQPFTREDLPRLHSHTRKRVEKLLAKVDTANRERDEFKVQSEEYGKIKQYLTENDISGEDANIAFELLRDIKKDPAKALQTLAPVIERLQRETGTILPEDLAQQVHQGYVTKEHAQELSRLRAEKARQTETQNRETTLSEQRRQHEAQVQAAKSITDALSAWERKWQASDPDYSKKNSEVQEALELAMARAQREGKLPKTPEEALKLVEDCRKRVEERIGRYQPPKQEVKHVSGGAAPTAMPRPKTSIEAILNAVNN
jgi:hypothetical protein